MIQRQENGEIFIPREDIVTVRAAGIFDPVGFIDRSIYFGGPVDEDEMDTRVEHLNRQFGLI